MVRRILSGWRQLVLVAGIETGRFRSIHSGIRNSCSSGARHYGPTLAHSFGEIRFGQFNKGVCMGRTDKAMITGSLVLVLAVSAPSLLEAANDSRSGQQQSGEHQKDQVISEATGSNLPGNRMVIGRIKNI